MKITILNGSTNPTGSALDVYLAQLKTALENERHTVTLLKLSGLDLHYCIGCFGCWVKTPGECVTRDASQLTCQAMIDSDFTLWAAPLHMGFPSALLKQVMDKSIPLIHPYFDVVNNEAHHRKRYAHYPRLGLLLEKEADTDETDLQIVADVFSRTALNMRSRLEFALTSETPAAETARRILTRPRTFVSFARRLEPTSGAHIQPPARLTLFNGSPRGRKGNTPILLTQFGEGFASLPAHAYELHHLNRLKDTARFVQAWAEAECVWLGFPLYTDAMPGMVKAFIEALEPLRGRPGNPPVGFLVQSGFPEAAHSRHIERYLQKLAARLSSPYLGTIVKGSGEGVRLMPEQSNQALFTAMQRLGRGLAETGGLEVEMLQQVAKPESYPAYLAPFFKIFVRTSTASWYWDSQLKQNGAYERRFARPYAQEN